MSNLKPCKHCGKDFAETANKCPHCGGQRFGVIAQFFGGCLIFGIALLSLRACGASDSAAPTQSPAPLPEKPVTKSNQAPSNRVDLTPKLKRELRDAIHRFGYVCPEVNYVSRKGLSPMGNVFKVACGPKGTSDIDTRLVYKFVLNTETAGELVTVWDGF
jgi:hypothetical protein